MKKKEKKVEGNINWSSKIKVYNFADEEWEEITLSELKQRIQSLEDFEYVTIQKKHAIFEIQLRNYNDDSEENEGPDYRYQKMAYLDTDIRLYRDAAWAPLGSFEQENEEELNQFILELQNASF